MAAATYRQRQFRVTIAMVLRTESFTPTLGVSVSPDQETKVQETSVLLN